MWAHTSGAEALRGLGASKECHLSFPEPVSGHQELPKPHRPHPNAGSAAVASLPHAAWC